MLLAVQTPIRLLTMGTSRGPAQEFHEEVDLDADTKETADEIFCNEETEESPHRITLFYLSDTPKPIINHFPRSEILRQIGMDVSIGRNKTSDVLMYEPHMARSFAAVTCRTNCSKQTQFVLRNACDASKQKRIYVTDPKGVKSDLLPTQEIELLEKTSFKLECVTFIVSVELGDVNARTFVLEIKSQDEQEIQKRQKSVSEPIPMGQTAVGGAHIGLSVRNSVESIEPFSEQVIPKVVASSMMSAPQHPYGQGYGIGPRFQGAGPPQYMPQVNPQHYLTGVQYSYNPVPQQTVNIQHQVGYCEIPTPIYPVHPQPQIRPSLPTNFYQPQLLERGGGYNPEPHLHQSGSHSRNVSMSELAQALADAQTGSPKAVPPTQTIVAHPASQDRNPVLYPSPAQPRFRFPQPDSPQSPTNLSDLPRGPPLGTLSPSHSVDLHPRIPANVVTTHAITESRREWDDIKKEPVEHTYKE